MKRREMLAAGGGAVLALSSFRFGWTAPADGKKQKVLYFTKSSGYEHSVVKRNGSELSFSDKLLTEWGQKAGFDVECTKDGGVFDGDLSSYDLFAFYATGNLHQPGTDKQPPVTQAGKQKLLEAIAGGKGCVGLHAASDAFHAPGPLDPFLAMLGGEFLIHQDQQNATLDIVSPNFPGIADLHAGNELTFFEEWYALKNFAKDLHVILMMETEKMKGKVYDRPRFPCTWARRHEKGRVFYTSFGHREDIWTNPKVQSIILGGIAWGLGNVEADVTPNINKVAPIWFNLT